MAPRSADVRPPSRARLLAGLPAMAALVLLAVVAWPAAPAQAEPASIERDFECGVFGVVDGKPVVERGAHGRIEVVPPRGVTTLLCIGDEDPPSRGALVLDHASTGELCEVTRDGAFVPTERWRAVVTPTGISILVCHSEPPGTDPPGRRGR